MSNSSTPIRWGIIGCGDVCEVKSGPAFQKIPGSQLQAVMRRNGELAADYARRHGVPTWYDDADSLLADPEVDAIYIATPPNTHAHYTLRAAAVGKPVYVEKPMARSFAECQEMIAACESAGVPLWVAYYRRRLPHYLKVHELLQAGTIGELRLVRIVLYQSAQPELVRAHQLKNWRVQPEIAGGGYFYDLASHQLDFLDYAIGPIESAQGLSANQAGLYPAEDIVSATWQHANGVMGNGIWCFTTAEEAAGEYTEIVGSKGRIRFPNFGKAEVELETGKGREVFSFENPPHIQQPLIETVMAELQGKGKCPSTGVSAARTNWVLEEMRSGE